MDGSRQSGARRLKVVTECYCDIHAIMKGESETRSDEGGNEVDCEECDIMDLAFDFCNS